MTLEPFPEDWSRGLAVVAHPDDLEYGAASAVAKWADAGKDIGYVMVTDGEAGIEAMPPDEVGPARRGEEIASAALVGVSTVEFLGHPDGMVVADLDLRRDLTRVIRRHRPEVVLSINFRDTWGGSAWNHADHRAVGIGLIDAARDAANRWVFPELVEEGHEPWAGLRMLAFSGSFRAGHYTDVTGWVHRAQASLLEHRLYLENLDAGMGSGDDPTAFLVDHAEAAGREVGVTHAVMFEVVDV